MRFLLVNQFYPPDMAPTGQYLHDLARALGSRGHDVEALCSRRSYDGGGGFPAEEVRDGVRVRRVAAFAFGRRGVGRAADYVSFLLAASARALRLRERYDLTLCLTTPPYVGLVVPWALGRRRGAVAHWVMDLYPDVIAAHGRVSPGSRSFRALQGLTRRQLAASRLVIGLGPHMAERLRPYAAGETRLEWVPLWAAAGSDHVDVAAERLRHGWGERDLVLLYSGNMGLGHRLEEFLEAALRGGGRSGAGRAAGSRTAPVWAFAGGGQRRGEVERFVAEHPGARVELLRYASQEELPARLAAADVHLVSLRSPWQGLVVPSKLQAASGLGRPVLFVGPRDSEPAGWLLESGGGWVVAEGDVDGLLKAVAEAGDPDERRRRGEAALAFARARFDRDANTRRIAELLEQAAGREAL